MKRFAALLALTMALAGCGSLLLDDPGNDTADPGTGGGDGTCSGEPTWEAFGASFVEGNCATCHTAAKIGSERLGAPAGIDFDTEEDVLRQQDAIRETVLTAGSMPPGMPLPSCEKQLLASFLDGAACVPSCEGRVCGDDGCGGSCGTCAGTDACSGSGSCECVPSCDGKACGDDGCGGTCGTCPGGQVCNSRDGVCSATCTPDCTGRTCGDDGCGGTCGTCGTGLSCGSDGTCACVPDCSGRVCGDDGCGGTCGSCGSGQSCDAGRCSAPTKTLSGDVMPIFTASCTRGCHEGNRPSDGLDLSSAGAAYRGLVNVRSGCSSKTFVVPGSPSTSYLIAKVGGGGSFCGSQMPGGGGADLTAAQIDTIRAWIAGGAANN